MDPTIPWFSHRYSPVTPRKFELIPHVSQRLGFMLRSEGGVDANNFNDCLETSKHRARVQCGQNEDDADDAYELLNVPVGRGVDRSEHGI